MRNIRQFLRDDVGSTTMEKVLIILIVFVVGVALLVALYSAINGSYGDGMSGIIRDIMH